MYCQLSCKENKLLLLFGLLQSPGQNLDDSSFASPLPTTKKPSTVQSKVRNDILFHISIRLQDLVCLFTIIVMWLK